MSFATKLETKCVWVVNRLSQDACFFYKERFQSIRQTMSAKSRGRKNRRSWYKETKWDLKIQANKRQRQSDKFVQRPKHKRCIGQWSWWKSTVGEQVLKMEMSMRLVQFYTFTLLKWYSYEMNLTLFKLFVKEILLEDFHASYILTNPNFKYTCVLQSWWRARLEDVECCRWKNRYHFLVSDPTRFWTSSMSPNLWTGTNGGTRLGAWISFRTSSMTSLTLKIHNLMCKFPILLSYTQMQQSSRGSSDSWRVVPRGKTNVHLGGMIAKSTAFHIEIY